jgi:hypothetical protein
MLRTGSPLAAGAAFGLAEWRAFANDDRTFELSRDKLE